jgi:hypothetical protein
LVFSQHGSLPRVVEVFVQKSILILIAHDKTANAAIFRLPMGGGIGF